MCRCALQETLTLGLVGQAMLEEQQPALVPLRVPGSLTVNLNVSLGSWAAVAPMVCFYPTLAPAQQQLVWSDETAGAGAGCAAAAEHGSSGIRVSTALGRTQQGLQYKHYHACVHDMPGAESMYLQGQLKARVEAGDSSAPSVGMYLPPLDMPAAAGGDADGEQELAAVVRQGSMGNLFEQQQLQQQRPSSAVAAERSGTDAAGTMSLDEVSAACRACLSQQCLVALCL